MVTCKEAREHEQWPEARPLAAAFPQPTLTTLTQEEQWPRPQVAVAPSITAVPSQSWFSNYQEQPITDYDQLLKSRAKTRTPGLIKFWFTTFHFLQADTHCILRFRVHINP